MPVVALPALGLVVAALMAILLLYGAQQIGRFIGHLVPDWHLPGLGSLRSAVLNGVNAALSATVAVFEAASAPVANFLLLPYHLLANLFTMTLDVLAATYNAIVRVTGYAQSLYRKAIAYAKAGLTALLAHVNHLYNLAIAYTVAAARSLLAHANHLYNLAITYTVAAARSLLAHANHLYNLAVSYAAAAAASVLAHANHLYNVARAAASAGEAAVLHEAQHLYNLAVSRIEARFAQGLKYADAVALSTATAAIGALTTDIGKVAHAEWVHISDDVRTLEGVIATDLPDIGALVRAIPQAIPLDIAATIGGTLALDRVLTRYLIDCGIPNCKNLGALGRELRDLLKMIEGAGFLAFLVALARDPQGTADETHGVLDTIITDTVGATRHLLGV